MFFNKSKSFFSRLEEQQLLQAIQEAEQNSSGEVRLHVEPYCPGDPYERAIKLFSELGMQHTSERNGVLFYLAYSDHKFALLGDQGINDKVPAGFWNNIKEQLEASFRQGEFAGPLCLAIRMAGEQLGYYFPYKGDTDKNELSNDISYGAEDA